MELPVKTLARFLKGKRVNDAAMGACHGFAIRITDPLSPVGAALRQVYGTDSGAELTGLLNNPG
jgi:hypothetical protein